MQGQQSEGIVPAVFNGVGVAVNGASVVGERLQQLLLTPHVLKTSRDLFMYFDDMHKTFWNQLPSFSQQAINLMYQDFSKFLIGYGLLLLADKGVAASEAVLPVAMTFCLSAMLVVFQYTLLLMAWLQKPQSWLHSSVLLLKLPAEWQSKPKPASLQLDVSSCNACNKLREIKGDMRSAILYCFQQLVLSGLKLLPLGSVVAFVPSVLTTGRMLAEYRYRTEGVCDRHIERTYQQNWEFFAALGLTHVAAVAFVSWIFNISLAMPADAVEPCLSGLIMLALVRLTYGMEKFPDPVHNSLRSFPIVDPTRWVVETSMDLVALKFKQNMRNSEVALRMFEDTHHYGNQLGRFFTVLKGCYDKQVQSSRFFRKTAFKYLLPTLFRESDQFLQDPIIGQWCLSQLNNWRSALQALLEYRKLILMWSSVLRPLNKIRSSLLVRIPLYLFGGVIATVNNIFTVNFVLNECGAYLSEFNEKVPYLRGLGVVSEKWSEKVLKITKNLESNIGVVKKILSELPESSREEFFNLLQDERFEKYLSSVIVYLNGFLAEQAFGFDVINSANLEALDDCDFPSGMFVPPNVDCVPPLPSDGGLEDWDDTGSRVGHQLKACLPSVNSSDHIANAAIATSTQSKAFFKVDPLPANSDDEWDDSDYRLERKLH